ncbi:hypothetical protein EF847_07715 [Actinobacteria bacterium YIM 96077]|uniref:VOC domain-containing protein n=1 Tax=Phytoactinopolyspora halophila TaxID=1981511 RepID=A0A329QJE0_9ACTN|nr:hypothetical protein [Phytoactinopolyspora halophila]AYY12612.1 hypothetical protein EF847_07715 [Actinobacteria bacterium YIM 96077]RAW12485.1 hypothetical protein DPM12_13875 [Phytoactinopolyspora halophila]
MSTLTPYVMVESARPFAEFLSDVFDAAVCNVVPLHTDPERVMHAEARIGSAELYFADAGPDGGQCQRLPTEPAHIQLWTTVPDAETTHARAITRGATSVMEVTRQDDHSRLGGFVAFGALWWVSTAA